MEAFCHFAMTLFSSVPVSAATDHAPHESADTKYASDRADREAHEGGIRRARGRQVQTCRGHSREIKSDF